MSEARIAVAGAGSLLAITQQSDRPLPLALLTGFAVCDSGSLLPLLQTRYGFQENVDQKMKRIPMEFALFSGVVTAGISFCAFWNQKLSR